jgi:hypothetical protein
MKNIKTIIGFTALIAVIIFTLGSCIINVPDDSGGSTPNYSLDGTWRCSGYFTVRVNGSSGYISQLNYSGIHAPFQSACDQNMIKVGDRCWRNISKTDDRTWRTQVLVVEYREGSYIATRVYLSDDYNTFTMSDSGQTLYWGDRTFTRQ